MTDHADLIARLRAKNNCHHEVGICESDPLAGEAADAIEKLCKIDLEANRFYRLMNGMDQDSHDARAEHIMQQSLDGLSIGPLNRTSTKAMLAEHFAAVEADALQAQAREMERMEKALRRLVEAEDSCDISHIAHIKERELLLKEAADALVEARAALAQPEAQREPT